MSRWHSPVPRMVALVMVLALVAAACGGGTSEETTTTAAGAETTTTAAGNDETTTTETAPEEEPADRGTLTIGWAFDPGTMDPQMHRQRAAQIVQMQLRDRLFYQAPPGIASTPLIAKELVQIDETTYEATLHEGVLFHNGDELTAEDVVFTYERLWDPATESPRATMGNMGNIESIEAVDRYTVRWTTSVSFGAPENAVLGLALQNQEILHKATYEALTLEEASAAHDVVGAGAFRFVEWLPDQRLVLDAFDDYWQGAPKVDRVVWRTIPEEATRTAELLAGSVDIIFPVSPDFVGQLRDAGMQVESQPGTAHTFLQMNVREGSPFADVEVRRAMNVAIDKETLVESVYAGLALVSDQMSGHGQEGFIDGYKPYEHDPEAPREVLSQITEPLEIFTLESNQLAAEVIAETLRGYGMDVTVVTVDVASYTSIGEAGDFDLMVSSFGYGSGEFLGSHTNNHFECVRFETDRVRTGFCDEELDAKIEAAKSAGTPEERAEVLDEVVRDLAEVHVPWVPLFVRSEVWAMQPYVEGFVGSSAGQFYDMHLVSLNK